MAGRVIKAKDIIEDIKSGTIYVTLLKKYRLTPVQFRGVFRQLLQAKVVEPYQLLGAAPMIGSEDAGGESLFDWRNRRFERLSVNFGMKLIESDKPHVKGTVVNISKLGLAVKGIKASAGDLMPLTILGNELREYENVELEAICRWIRREYDDDSYVGGFEAMLFYEGSLENLLSRINGMTGARRDFGGG